VVGCDEAVHVARALVQGLKALGVRLIFTLNGGHIQALYAGCVEEGVRVVDVRHEQAAAMAADALARVSRGLGVAIVTAGPGLTNAITGIANAHANDSPLLVLCGQAPQALRGRGALQELNHVELVRPITVWANSCREASRAPEYLAEACKEALEARGPALLEVPMDILLQECEGAFVWTEPSIHTPPEEGLRRAAALLSQAEKPLILAGAGCYWSGAVGELRALAEEMLCPVYAQSLARGSLPPRHPLRLSLARREALKEADCILLVGTCLDFRLDYGADLGAEARVIQLDYKPGRLGLNRPDALTLRGDVKMGLARLRELVRGENRSVRRAWAEFVRGRELEAFERLKAEAPRGDKQVAAIEFCEEVARFVKEDTLVIGDGRNVVSRAAKVVEVGEAGRFLDPGPLGCLGIGLPFALGAKLARPELDVLVIQGDGSLGFNFMEFHTLVRLGIPVLCAVGNDGGWGQERAIQRALFGDEMLVATELGFVRYDEAVKALGGYGELVDRREEVLPALKRAKASGRPACVNVLVDPSTNIPLGIPHL
jgi:acetolactate synthase-1/2/3 large subunit